jgi:hypothetical protein
MEDVDRYHKDVSKIMAEGTVESSQRIGGSLHDSR